MDPGSVRGRSLVTVGVGSLFGSPSINAISSGLARSTGTGRIVDYRFVIGEP